MVIDVAALQQIARTRTEPRKSTTPQIPSLLIDGFELRQGMLALGEVPRVEATVSQVNEHTRVDLNRTELQVSQLWIPNLPSALKLSGTLLVSEREVQGDLELRSQSQVIATLRGRGGESCEQT